MCPDCGDTKNRDLSAAKNVERRRTPRGFSQRWFDGIYIPVRSEQTVSSTEISWVVDKPRMSHSKTTVKQEVNAKTTNVQLSPDEW